MIALVNIDDNILVDISARLHNALKAAPVDYTAEKYGDPIKHPDEELYALKVIQKEDYHEVIESELTAEEQSWQQTIGEDWFPPIDL